MIKRKITVFVVALATLLASVNVQPRNANAIISHLAGPVGVAGWVVFYVGVAGALGASFNLVPPKAVAPTGIAAIVAIIVGIVLLDDHQQPSLAFASVTDADGRRAGLTDIEIDAYNENIDELNAVVQSVGSDLGQMEQPSPQLVDAKFSEYGGGLPAEALSGARKIAAEAARQLSQASH